MIVQILLYVAIAIILTWLIVWFLRKNEKNTKYRALKAQLAANNLSVKRGSVRYEWVAFAELEDEHYEDSNVSAVLVGDKIKLMLEPNNLNSLHTDVHLLRQVNEALHNSNNDFDQKILSLEGEKTDLEDIL